MPLLGKTRFAAQNSLEILNGDDEVYVCRATGEVFKDYEKFFDQTILCNSLIWTCEMTGRGNLTFTEAVESEENSRKQINSFPESLHLPILHLVSLTNRTVFKDLLDDIYSFAKDRYFIGEQITVSTETERKNAIVIKVFPVINLSGASKPNNNFVTEQEIGADGQKRIVIRSSKKAIIDSSLFQYMSQDVKTGTTVMSTAKNMSRNRNLFNRDTCRLFLKEHCEHPGKGNWKLKDMVMRKYNLSNVKFGDYFAGPVPNFPGSDDAPDVSNGEVKKILDKKETVAVAKKEQERKQTEKEWAKPRDDMLCDDLLDLPVATPLKMSGDDFGNAVMIMEFMTGFKSLCGLDLPSNFNIVALVESLYEQHTPSLYLDLIQQLLLAIFQMQSGLPELNSSWKAACKYDQDIQDSMALIKIYQSANTIKKLKSNKALPFLESPLRHLPMDTSSLTELVRLHLLVGCDDASNQSDGSYDVKTEYIASEFSRTNPEIMKKLGSGNILDLKPGEKLLLMACLIDQILCLPACRDLIEDNYNKLKNAQKDLRTHMYAVQRREKDFINYNLKKKQEEEMMKSHKKNDKPSESNVSNGNTKKKSSILDLKDKDFEEMPVEGIDWDQLNQQEKDHIRNWSQRRQAELQQIVDNLQSECFLTPIGSDRTYRRYWLFRSVPGLFVEDSRAQNWTIPRCCLSPIKQDEGRIEMGLKAAMNKLESGNEQKNLNTIDKYFTSDARKDVSDATKSSTVANVQQNPVLTSPTTSTTSNKKTSFSCLNVQEQLKTRGVVEWSIFTSAEQLDVLIERLNKRGYRESSLKTYLINNRDKIINTNMAISSTNTTNRAVAGNNNNNDNVFQFLLSEPDLKDVPKDVIQIESDEDNLQINSFVDNCNADGKSRLNGNSNKSQRSKFQHFGGITGELELMKCVADMLLDLEERIFAGGLGQLKELERETWRKELECTDELMNGGHSYCSNGKQSSLYTDTSATVDDDIDVYDAQMRFNKKNLKKMLKMLVDVHQMLDEKYVIPPLGENEEAKLKRLKMLEQQQQMQQLQQSVSEQQQTNFNVVRLDDLHKNGEVTGTNANSADNNFSTATNNSTNTNCDDLSASKVLPNGVPINNFSTTVDVNILHDDVSAGSDNNNKDGNITNNNITDNNSNNNINGTNNPSNDNSNNATNIDNNVNSANNIINGSLSKWLHCIDSCSNFSQLYLCIGLLDMSIAWSRSALNARCKICRKKKDAELMLLCDGCDQGHHMYCLKPPLKKIPEGDWYCPMCRPKELSIVICPRKVTKNIKYKDYESDYDEDADSTTNGINRDENEDEDAEADASKNSSYVLVGRVVDDDENSLDNAITRNGAPPSEQSYTDSHNTKLSTNFTNTKFQDKKQSQKTSHVQNVTTSLSTNNATTANSTTTSKVSPSTGKLTRSGREIIKPKANDEFIVNQPSIKPRKRNRLLLDEPEMQKKSKRQCRSTKYSDDFDYVSGNYCNDGDEEDEDYEVFNRVVDGDDDDYGQVKRRGRKRKKRDHESSDAGSKSSKKKSKTSSPASKTSHHRQTSASMKAVEDLVNELMKNDNAWPFLKPVTIKEAPDYFEIIDRPMDLSTIKYKIYRFEYSDQHAIIDDLRLMFDNCNLYNSPNTPVHDAGVALEEYLDQRLEQIENGSSRVSNGNISKTNMKRNSL